MGNPAVAPFSEAIISDSCEKCAALALFFLWLQKKSAIPRRTRAPMAHPKPIPPMALDEREESEDDIKDSPGASDNVEDAVAADAQESSVQVVGRAKDGVDGVDDV